MDMTIEEKIKALMSGRRFRSDSVELYYDKEGTIPFVLLHSNGSTSPIHGYWKLDWEEIIEKPWQPVHGEKVLCRNCNIDAWKCAFFSHKNAKYYYSIGGSCWDYIEKFDIEKLGKV